jgi:hypothetical protein
MAYLGIGYSGPDSAFLRDLAHEHDAWLKGDRALRFFGDRFVVLYDSNTAREFAARCLETAPEDTVRIYAMKRPHEIQRQPS